MTPDNTWTTSSGTLSIDLTEAGLYKFFVIFEDNNEVGDTANIFKALGEGKTNAEIQEDYQVDDATLDNYRNYIFTFEIYDNAPISVKAKDQGVAYIGVKVNAVPFELKNYNSKTVYKLEFKAEGSETWTEIQPVSKLQKGDEGYDVAYNGSLEFVPQAKGVYRITCTITKNKKKVTMNMYCVNTLPTTMN